MAKDNNTPDNFISDDTQKENNNYLYFIIMLLLFSVSFVIGFKYISYSNVSNQVNERLNALEKKIQSLQDDHKKTNEY